MRKRAIQVIIDAQESSVVELTVAERVQLDLLTKAEHGYVAERHGNLLDPGVTTVPLNTGKYFLKTLSDANIRLVSGGITTAVTTNEKDAWPDPPVKSSPPIVISKGDDRSGKLPNFTITPHRKKASV